MPSRRVRWIVGLLLVALLGGGAGWHWLRPGARREKVGLLVTASLRASLTARTKGDVQFGGVALLSSALHELRRRYGEDAVAYLDAGNALFGDIGQFEFAQQMPGVLRGWNCRALTVGYRDFEVLAALPDIGIPLVACNLRGKVGASTPIPSLKLELRGVKIGVVGLVDPRAPFEQSDDVSRREIMDEAESLRALKAEVARLRAEGVRLVVALSSALESQVNLALAEQCPQLDFIVTLSGAGHGGRSTPQGTRILAPAWDGEGVGVIEIPVDPNRGGPVRWREFSVSSSDYLPDRDMRRRIRQYWLNRLKRLGDDRVIGTTRTGLSYQVPNDLPLEFPFWRYFNRPMYNFVVDAIREEYPRWRARHPAGATPAAPGTPDLVLYNSGAIEAGLPEGVVTASDLTRAIPYNNRILELNMTGAQVLAILNAPALRDHGLLLVSGLRYVWDYTKGLEEAYLIGRDRKAVRLSDGATYRVLLSDFLAEGGDRYLENPVCQPLRQQVEGLQPAPKDSTNYPGTIELVERYLQRHSPVVETNFVDDRVQFRRSR